MSVAQAIADRLDHPEIGAAAVYHPHPAVAPTYDSGPVVIVDDLTGQRPFDQFDDVILPRSASVNVRVYERVRTSSTLYSTAEAIFRRLHHQHREIDLDSGDLIYIACRGPIVAPTSGPEFTGYLVSCDVVYTV